MSKAPVRGGHWRAGQIGMVLWIPDCAPAEMMGRDATDDPAATRNCDEKGKKSPAAAVIDGVDDFVVSSWLTGCAGQMPENRRPKKADWRRACDIADAGVPVHAARSRNGTQEIFARQPCEIFTAQGKGLCDQVASRKRQGADGGGQPGQHNAYIAMNEVGAVCRPALSPR